MRNFAENNYSKPAPTNDEVEIELDEMWHFLRSKKDKFGFGKPTAEQQNNSSTGNVELETRRLSKKMYNRFKKWNVKVYFSDRYRVYR